MPSGTLIVRGECKDGAIVVHTKRDEQPEEVSLDTRVDDVLFEQLGELVKDPARDEKERDMALMILAKWGAFRDFMAVLGGDFFTRLHWEYPDDIAPPWGSDDLPGGGAAASIDPTPLLELQGMRQAARELVGAGA
jgi:hypothetical protein